MQHDPRNLFPIGAVGFGVEQAQIRDAGAARHSRSERAQSAPRRRHLGRAGDFAWTIRKREPRYRGQHVIGQTQLRTTWCLICITRPWFGAQEALQPGLLKSEAVEHRLLLVVAAGTSAKQAGGTGAVGRVGALNVRKISAIF